MKAAPQGKKCPVCGEGLDIDTLVPGQGGIDYSIKPEPDDVSFCFKCRTVLVFNDAMNLVVPNKEQLYYIINDEGFHRFINQIDQAQANKPNMN